MEAVVDCIWRKECLIVKELIDIYKLDVYIYF